MKLNQIKNQPELNLKMTNLTEILYLLDQQVIYDKIDAPIDDILKKYSYSISEDKTQKEFISIISGFLKELKTQGILLSIGSEEFLEVFWYLERYYKDEDSEGYERALNDYEEYGIQMILEETCEALKMDQRSRYLSWVHDTKINYLEWDEKLKLTEDFLDQFDNFFPNEVSGMPNEQLAPFLKEFLNRALEGTEVIKSIAETKLFN